MLGEEATQARVVGGERRQPLAHQRPLPPGAGRVAGRGELVAVEAGADVAWGGRGEGGGGGQAEGTPGGVEELPPQVAPPGAALRGRTGGGPGLAVDAARVGRGH